MMKRNPMTSRIAGSMNSKPTDTVPTPGSDAALALGCRCAVLDNHYGKGFPWPRTDGKDPVEHPSFWVTEGCPVHRPRGIMEGEE
jgi:hypothetical protein